MINTTDRHLKNESLTAQSSVNDSTCVKTTQTSEMSTLATEKLQNKQIPTSALSLSGENCDHPESVEESSLIKTKLPNFINNPLFSTKNTNYLNSA